MKYRSRPDGEKKDIDTERNAPITPACNILAIAAGEGIETPSVFLAGSPQLGQYSAPCGNRNPQLSQ